MAPAGRHRGGSVLLFATRHPAAWGLCCRTPSKQTAFSRVSHQHCLQLPRYSLAKAAITVTKITKCTRFPVPFKMTGGTQNMARSTRSSVEICAIFGCSYNQRKLRNVLPMQCFDHKPLPRKQCSCGPTPYPHTPPIPTHYPFYKMPGNTDTNGNTLGQISENQTP